MKTFKLMLAAMAVSMLTLPAFAQGPPPEVQNKIRQVEKFEKGNAKAKARKDKDKDKQDNGKSAKKDKSAEKEKGKDKSTKKDRDKDRDKDKSAKKDKSAEKEKGKDKSAKKDEAPVKDRDGLAKEERKHLLRLAKIERIAQIAVDKDNDRLLAKTVMLRDKETSRYQRAMARLTASTAVEAPTEESP